MCDVNYQVKPTRVKSADPNDRRWWCRICGRDYPSKNHRHFAPEPPKQRGLWEWE